MYDKAAPAFGDSLDEPTRSMLKSYCLISVQVDELNERIEKEGYLVDEGKGARENPLVNIVHKMNADKARYFAPLKRVLREEGNLESFEKADKFMGY